MADGITIRAENLRFDGKQFTKTMDRELQALFTEAARAFLIAAVRRIHVRTGFLRGAFSRLEDVVGTFQASVARVGRSGLGSLRRGTGTGARPDRDLASSGRRLIRLRERQIRIIREIKQIQKREKNRRTRLNKKLSDVQNTQGGNLADKQLQAITRENRAKALRDRAAAQRLIKRARANEEAIRKAVKAFEAKLKFDPKKNEHLRSVAVDVRRSTLLRIQIIQQKRNEAFQRSVKRLRQQYFGKRGQRGQTIQGTINREEFDKRLAKLRRKIVQPTRTQRRLRATLQRSPSVRMKKKLDAYRRKLQLKYQDRLEDARLSGEHERFEKLVLHIQKRIAEAERKVRNAKRKQESDAFLLTLQRQARAQSRRSSEALESLRLRSNSTNEDIRNVVARTTRGRVVGQNTPGKFNLRTGERVKKIFNANRDSSGKLVDPFLEFYYPVKGSPQSKMLKTPRSGRRFATPANLIITRQQSKINPNLQVFKQLSGFVKASGGTVSADVQRQIADTTQLNTLWEFHFAVDIRYLAINDIKESWAAWISGILAFNQVILTKGPARLPKLSQFYLKSIHRLSPGTPMKIEGRA